MTDKKINEKVKVRLNIFAGNRVWNVGIYPNEKNPDADILFRIAKELEEKGVPLKSRAVVFYTESAPKIAENPFDGGININTNPNNENGGEPLENSLDNNSDNENLDENKGNENETLDDNESDENETSFLSVEDFSELKVKEQKEYLQLLYDDENIDGDKFYELASDYMQVVENTTVKNFINKCFAEMESDNEDE